MKLTDESKFLLGIVVATIILIGISYLFLNRPAAPPTPVDKALLIPSQNRLEKGNASASAYLVEFSDYQCPACAAFDPVVRQLTDKYQNDLYFIYRDFPLEQHPLALTAATAARAAAVQGKYWEMHAKLFENQASLTETLITSLAGELSLDLDKFNNDKNSADIRSLVDQDQADGIRLRINATPTFFLNGIKLELMEPADLVRAVEEALSK